MKKGILFLIVLGLLVPGMSGCASSGLTLRNGSSAKDIPEQFRAVLVENVPLADTGAIRKGDYVDILHTLRLRLRNIQAGPKKVTVTLLQNMLVLDVIRAKRNEKAGSLIVAMSPRDAQYFVLATHIGEITVSQRGKDDHARYVMPIADIEGELFSEEEVDLTPEIEAMDALVEKYKDLDEKVVDYGY